ncbi:MAG TPA: hypothetical protein GXX40_02310 [Firmicutes bacterium]|nr:hypothetical protein [Bacillota bacterium]
MPPEVLFNVLFVEVCGIRFSGVPGSRVRRSVPALLRGGCGDQVPDDTTLLYSGQAWGGDVPEAFVRVSEEAKQKGVIRSKWAIVDGTKVIARTSKE